MIVITKALGGKVKETEIEEGSNLGDLKEQLGLEGYTASVAGESQDEDYELDEYDVVNFSPAAKAGM